MYLSEIWCLMLLKQPSTALRPGASDETEWLIMLIAANANNYNL